MGSRPARFSPTAVKNLRVRDRSVNEGFVPFGGGTFSPVDHTDLARRIYTAAHLTGTFTLRSGVVSSEYFDKYRFESDPVLLADIAGASAALIPDGIDALAGLELGGVPLATMLSQITGLPVVFVRKEAKTYGTCKIAEGIEIDGLRLCIVEDVVTSGGAILDAAVELRARGAKLGPVTCVIDRESGGRERLTAAELELRALYTMSELKAAAGAGA
jgi:orotate phosphoribosyltransferase